eukprot:TRINITY_DN16409_c0_g1_i1.p1 TRINITY_DN16409_c0_g1~~TRINITY_DN16409_c0_g1_i1.p1  ORF type:complete len:526 (+),score=55.39 TRINITY_DN16409_c0_g1_i1:50-1579(+)
MPNTISPPENSLRIPSPSDSGSVMDIDLASPKPTNHQDTALLHEINSTEGGTEASNVFSGPSVVRMADDPKDIDDRKQENEMTILPKLSKPTDPRHGTWSACLNFINSIVGAGIIGLPFAFKEIGDIPGTLIILTIAFLTDCSVRLIINLGSSTGYSNYEDLAKTLLGPHCGYLVLFAMVVFAYGAMVSYLIIIGDTLPVVFKSWFSAESMLHDRCAVIALAGGLGCLPLCSLNDIGKLGRFSGFSLFAIALLIVFVLIRMGDSKPDINEKTTTTNNDEKSQEILQGIGQILFAFVCHHSSFLVRSSMKNPKLWSGVTHFSVSVACCLSVVLAVAGHRTFKDCTRPNVLNSFKVDDEVINVARLLLSVTMILTYPMEFFVARTGLTGLFVEDRLGLKKSFFYLLTLVIFIATLIPSLYLNPDDLALVLSFTGGTAASILGFIIPGALYFSHALLTEGWSAVVFTRKAVIPVVLIVLGGVLLFSNLYYSAKDITEGIAYHPPAWCPDTGI